MRRQQVPVKAPNGSPGGSPELHEDTTNAALAKALGHPARIGIVSMLHERQTCIGCDIVEEIGLAQSTTSEHLRILKAAGIITGEIERPRVCYSLNPMALEPLRHFLNKLAEKPAAKSGSEQGPE
ncbi:MAG: metalloregulator ArsR/SmtB family transcription factor [Rhodospirillales bacterium]|nr:metalloregulator ArsR/SmtB family transcription factor [Rhodospirillales bacterium]